jgi:hypothetical protein
VADGSGSSPPTSRSSCGCSTRGRRHLHRTGGLDRGPWRVTSSRQLAYVRPEAPRR